MKLTIVAAMDKNRVIGQDNKMPWHLPADFKHFKRITLGKPIIMGRKTFESIGRVLPKRQNIVISHNPNYKPVVDIPAESSLQIRTSLESALLHIPKETPEVMIIGGAMIYEQILPKADTLYLTYVDATLNGDRFFPEIDPEHWQETWREQHLKDSKNQFDFAIVRLERKP